MSAKNMTATSTTNNGQVNKQRTISEINAWGQNCVSKTTPNDVDAYHYDSLKGSIKKSVSSSSISTIQSSNFQDSYRFASHGSPRQMSRSRENLVVKGSGRNTIGHEPGFRDRLPSFTVRQQLTASELQTHFAVYKFVPRHGDEVALCVGDPVCVKQIHEDLWCDGKNLRTGYSGIFPSRYVSDILSHTGSKFEFSDNGVQFFLRFLGSVEVYEFKGNTVLCQAVAKILSMRNSSKLSELPPCSLEINYRGIRMVDHAQENEKRQPKSLVGRLFNNEHKVTNAKFFFNLKDVTFCGCYPSSPRYFGFVTKHPSEHRFACHIFMSEFSTEPVAKAIGQAFKRFSTEFLERSSTR